MAIKIRRVAGILVVLAGGFFRVSGVQADWPMTAANPQRTSWVSDEVRGPYNPVWYRPIDPYIDNKVQAIVANNAVYVSTSKGLYAFNADTGAQLWVYGTEMPLGNSPAIATVNGKSVAYVGGFDHRVHAVDTTSGAALAGYTPFEAGAGYDTNPLVINNVAYVGNRDGNFYALNAATGAKIWQYTTGGPIHYSAAYKNGVVYFASDDSYAYALNASTGTLVWKTGKFPGVGFDMYWPVIYTDPASSKDYVIFVGAIKGDERAWFCGYGSSANLLYGCGDHSQIYEMYDGKSGLCGGVSNSTSNNISNLNDNNYLWPVGSQVIKCDVVFDYFNNNSKWNGQPPYWRIVYILDRATGVEKTPYPPFNSSPNDGGGAGYHQPPIVNGNQNLLYTFVGYIAGGNAGASNGVVGWKFGTPYLSRVIDEFGTGMDGASDEPRVLTSGGNMVYYGEGNNHQVWGAIEVSKPLGSNAWWLWDTRNVPGASTKYTNISLDSKFGGANGPYSYFDGLLNFSPVPYNGKLYYLQGNVVFAVSPSGTANSPLPTAPAPQNQASGSVATTRALLQQKLDAEIQKMISAGHLRPGFHDSGGWGGHIVPYNIPGNIPGNLGDYFSNPADTLMTLAMAYPHVSSPLQTQLKTYMQQEETNFPVETIAQTGWKLGARRENFDDTPEMTAVINQSYDANSYIASNNRTSIWYPNTCCGQSVFMGNFPVESFYGAWKYALWAKSVGLANEPKRIFDAMKNKLPLATAVVEQGPTPHLYTDANQTLLTFPYILNRFVAGYRGYLELEKLAGYTADISQSNKYNEYTRILNLRVSNFNKDTPWTDDSWGGDANFNNALNIARNFMFLVPELGEALRASKLTQVEQALAEYEVLAPYWFVSKYNRSYSETYSQPLYDYPSLFQARAYILKQPVDELAKYLDIPAFERGDLFYIQNLVAALNSADSGPPTVSGDLNGDDKVNLEDLTQAISSLNIFTFNTVVANYGKQQL